MNISDFILPPLLIILIQHLIQFKVYIAASQLQILLHIFHLLKCLPRHTRLLNYPLIDFIRALVLFLSRNLLINALGLTIIVGTLNFPLCQGQFLLLFICHYFDVFVLINEHLVLSLLLFFFQFGLDALSNLLLYLLLLGFLSLDVLGV